MELFEKLAASMAFGALLIGCTDSQRKRESALPPAPPTVLAAQVLSPQCVWVTWNDRSSDEHGFHIERAMGTAPQGLLFERVRATGPNETTYVDAGLEPTRTYHYRVRAFGLHGTSLYTETISVTTPLEPATNVSAAFLPDARVNVSWTPGAGAWSFVIERSTDAASFSAIASQKSPGSTWVDSNVSASTTYTYRVRSVSEDGRSTTSAPATVVTPGPPPPPSAPSDLRATRGAGATVTLSWRDNSTDESGFDVERSGDGGGTWVNAARLAPGSISYVDASAPDSAAILYRVSATNAWSRSSFTTTGIERTEPGTWTALQGSATGAGLGRPRVNSWISAPSIAAGASGFLYVVWVDGGDYPAQVRLLKWDGTTWVALGGSNSTGGLSQSAGWTTTFHPIVRTDSLGRPVVAYWGGDAQGGGLLVKRWTGVAWEPVGAGVVGVGDTNGNGVGLGLDASDQPVVAWSCRDAIRVRRWNGAAWNDVGASVGSARHACRPSVALVADQPVVAWHEYGSIHVHRWTGEAWSAMPAVTRAGDGQSPAVATDPAGRLGICWTDNSSGSWQIRFKLWDGSAWTELAGSGSGRGVTDMAGSTFLTPALVFDAAGRPIVAAQMLSGTPQMLSGTTNPVDPIFVRRWNGSAWSGLDNSATTGINGDNPGPSGWTLCPSIAVDTQGRPAVVWYDTTVPGCGIYLKKWNPAP
ncbi:MAG: hypothetical protein L0216_09125 [Planctomycetales bacterium]|nr:hypothetical protein [Planctomycetales bacterium]